MSSSLNGTASRFTDQYLTSVSVCFFPRPHRSVWRRPLSLSHVGQPMKHLQPNQPTVRQIPRETVQRKHELSGRTPESTRKPPGRSHTCRSNPR